MSQSFNSDNKEDEKHAVHNPYDSLFKEFTAHVVPKERSDEGSPATTLNKNISTNFHNWDLFFLHNK